MEDKKNVVLKAMQDAGKPVRPGEVANATGIESKEVSKLIQELKKDVSPPSWPQSLSSLFNRT